MGPIFALIACRVANLRVRAAIPLFESFPRSHNTTRPRKIDRAYPDRCRIIIGSLVYLGWNLSRESVESILAFFSFFFFFSFCRFHRFYRILGNRFGRKWNLEIFSINLSSGIIEFKQRRRYIYFG